MPWRCPSSTLPSNRGRNGDRREGASQVHSEDWQKSLTESTLLLPTLSAASTQTPHHSHPGGSGFSALLCEIPPATGGICTQILFRVSSAFRQQGVNPFCNTKDSSCDRYLSIRLLTRPSVPVGEDQKAGLTMLWRCPPWLADSH